MVSSLYTLVGRGDVLDLGWVVSSGGKVIGRANVNGWERVHDRHTTAIKVLFTLH